MYALKCAFRDKSPMLRSASRHSKYSNLLPQLRRSMDGQPSLLNNNCSVLRRRAQLEPNSDLSQLKLGDFDDKFYRPRFIHGRKFQRTWAELEIKDQADAEESQNQEHEEEEEEDPAQEDANEPHWKQCQRYDEVMYDPKPIQERAIQCTWKEHDDDASEDEPEVKMVHLKRLPKKEELGLQQKPQKRVSKQRMAMSSYITQMLSNQNENKQKNYECGLRGYRQDNRY